MPVALYLISVFILIPVHAQPQNPVQLHPVVVGDSHGPRSSCPSVEILQSARRNLSASILLALPTTACGGFGWTQVANINMSDSTQECPSPWTLFSFPVRSCSTTSPGCHGFTLTAPVASYTRVCGRAIGHQYRTTDAFQGFLPNRSIDTGYLDGVSFTHGSPRQHIWSLAAGIGNYHCPCEVNNPVPEYLLPPSFVGDNYYCDSYTHGALWDGLDCTSTCCLETPPYFNVTLRTPSSDNLEIRICTDQTRSDEAVHISLVQLYVQ